MFILYQIFFRKYLSLHCKNIQLSIKKNESFINKINFCLIEHKVIQQITSVNVFAYEKIKNTFLSMINVRSFFFFNIAMHKSWRHNHSSNVCYTTSRSPIVVKSNCIVQFSLSLTERFIAIHAKIQKFIVLRAWVL